MAAEESTLGTASQSQLVRNGMAQMWSVGHLVSVPNAPLVIRAPRGFHRACPEVV